MARNVLDRFVSVATAYMLLLVGATTMQLSSTTPTHVLGQSKSHRRSNCNAFITSCIHCASVSHFNGYKRSIDHDVYGSGWTADDVRPSICTGLERQSMRTSKTAINRHSNLELHMLWKGFTGGKKRRKRRTYVVDTEIFKSIETLNDFAEWSSRLMFSDIKPVTDFIQGSALWGTATLIGSFNLFPLLVGAVRPLIVFSDTSDTHDEIALNLSSSFLPGISLLFGALFSYTLGILVTRQQKLEDLVNQEVAIMSTLSLNLMKFFEVDRPTLNVALEKVWMHTNTLIWHGRFQELIQMIEDDPIDSLLLLINNYGEKRIMENTNPNLNRDKLNYLRIMAKDLSVIRSQRLNAEGRVFPPYFFAILGTLVFLLLIGFALESVDPSGQVALESKVLFSVMVWAYSLLLEFLNDLGSPFVGNFNIRRTVTTGWLLRIRREVVKSIGSKRMTEFDRELRVKNLATRRSISNRVKYMRRFDTAPVPQKREEEVLEVLDGIYLPKDGVDVDREIDDEAVHEAERDAEKSARFPSYPIPPIWDDPRSKRKKES